MQEVIYEDKGSQHDRMAADLRFHQSKCKYLPVVYDSAYRDTYGRLIAKQYSAFLCKMGSQYCISAKRHNKSTKFYVHSNGAFHFSSGMHITNLHNTWWKYAEDKVNPTHEHRRLKLTARQDKR